MEELGLKGSAVEEYIYGDQNDYIQQEQISNQNQSYQQNESGPQSKQSSRNFIIHKNNQKTVSSSTRGTNSNFYQYQRPTTGPSGSRQSLEMLYKQSKVDSLNKEADFFRQNLKNYDKEQLFINLQDAKNTINLIKDENNQLKTKNLNMERELQRYEKIIEDLNQNFQGRGKLQETKISQKSQIYVSLRKQVKDQQIELKLKNTELETIKKNLKYTKFQEIEIEKKQFAEETIRLRNYIQELQNDQKSKYEEIKNKELQKQCLILKDMADELRNDNTQMAGIIRKMEEKYNENDKLFKESQRNYQKEMNNMKKILKDRENELRNLKLENQTLIQKYQSIQAQFLQTNQNSPNSHNLNKILSKERQLKDEIEKLGNQLRQAREQLHDKDQLIQQMNYRLKNQQSIHNKQKHYSQQNNLNQIQLSEGNNIEEDLQQIAKELRCHLILNNIPFESLEQLIIPEDLELKGKVSQQEMRIILGDKPFEIDNSIKRDILSGFLTEDPTKRNQDEQQNNYQGIALVREKFILFVGDYDILQEQEFQNVRKEIQEILSQQFFNIKKSLESQSKEFINSKQIEKALNNNGIFFEENQNNLFWFLIYLNCSKDFNKISLEGFFNTFDLLKMISVEDSKKKIQRPSNHPNKEKNQLKPSHSRNLSQQSQEKLDQKANNKLNSNIESPKAQIIILDQNLKKEANKNQQNQENKKSDSSSKQKINLLQNTNSNQIQNNEVEILISQKPSNIQEESPKIQSQDEYEQYFEKDIDNKPNQQNPQKSQNNQENQNQKEYQDDFDSSKNSLEDKNNLNQNEFEDQTQQNKQLIQDQQEEDDEYQDEQFDHIENHQEKLNYDQTSDVDQENN